MNIIEIQALENGGHRNQCGDFKTAPKGWAVIPDTIETPNFPFGDVAVEEIDGVMTVTKWFAGVLPESTEPIQENEQSNEQVTWDALAAAYAEGVNEA